MVMAEAVFQVPQKIKFPEFNPFVLKDQELIQIYIDTFKPFSCEYNFSNLYAWQDAYKLSWTLYQERLLVYDEISQCAFMPLGKDFCPEELVILSLNMKNAGLTPEFSLVASGYLKKFSEIENYFIIKEEPDYAEYIYDVDKLCELTGKKLHKKRNLISQFKRTYPDFKVHPLKGEARHKALGLAQSLMFRGKRRSHTLDQEFGAMEISFDSFDQLGLEGLAITVGNKVVAFSVFSQLNHSTYDIQFEKSDMDFKGSAQVINHETAKFLKNKCQYLNREQDLGIKGLRQAKMSYDPEKLITMYRLIFAPPN
ncbi:MAG: phosphatidylglycerol lysyltransferase domain-containing protein [Desulfobacula sp.]|uniref:DUF2156 domain-containing protein n=1 Tax=Desulfobacula sp. TaxID=2593537 RepID=UPI0025C14224|nr:phosphatidylglycerol lysyltransferase domain-containing protein [Desulfobacula sp.]MCD4721921.1 phosphatidylglycerol lysyltransferase domain-containing protein [Desulfobacula sp.]